MQALQGLSTTLRSRTVLNGTEQQLTAPCNLPWRQRPGRLPSPSKCARHAWLDPGRAEPAAQQIWQITHDACRLPVASVLSVLRRLPVGSSACLLTHSSCAEVLRCWDPTTSVCCLLPQGTVVMADFNFDDEEEDDNDDQNKEARGHRPRPAPNCSLARHA